MCPAKTMVLTDGLEPPTLCSSGRRSTDWATSARKWQRVFTFALGVFGRVRCSSGIGWIHSSTNPPNQTQDGGLTGNRTPNNGVTSQHYSRLTMSPHFSSANPPFRDLTDLKRMRFAGFWICPPMFSKLGIFRTRLVVVFQMGFMHFLQGFCCMGFSLPPMTIDFDSLL